MFKIIKATHVTAREREVIKWMLETGTMNAKTKQKTFAMSDLEGNQKLVIVDKIYKIIIEVK